MPRTRLRTLFARYVAFAERRTATLLVTLLAVAAAALAMALRLELHTDMAELLPRTHRWWRCAASPGGRRARPTW